MSDEESDYEEASPEQKLRIANYFIMSSPNGEVSEVITDVKKLVNDNGLLSDKKLGGIMKEYNVQNMVAAKDPEGDSKLVVTAHGQVGDDLYVDPATGRVLKFDHVKRQFTEVTQKKQVLSDDVDSYRKEIETLIKTYVGDEYKGEKCTPAVYGSDSGVVSVCLSASNVNLGNFWTGSWRSVYTVNVSKKGSAELKGSVKINVHYFEDGNVQLNTNLDKTVKVEVGSEKDTAAAVVAAISKLEDEYHTELEEMFVSMHQSTFKNMRRFLPLSRQRMNWNVAAHKLANEVGK